MTDIKILIISNISLWAATISVFLFYIRGVYKTFIEMEKLNFKRFEDHVRFQSEEHQRHAEHIHKQLEIYINHNTPYNELIDKTILKN